MVDKKTYYWNVDLHSHTFFSPDCLVHFEDIIQVCKTRSIDKIAITDHNTIQGALQFQKIAPDLVIVGEEIFTTQGEILAYFVQEEIPPNLTPKKTIELLRSQNAVISVSHPFDRFRQGAWRESELLDIIDDVDAIEGYNARCILEQDNIRAKNFAKQRNVLVTAGSDAHTRLEYGRALTYMPQFNDADEFRNSLRDAQIIEIKSPLFVHFGSKLAKWTHKLGLRIY